MRSDGGAVRSAGVELDDPGVFDRIVGAFYRIWRVWIGHQQTAAAGNEAWAGELAVVATQRVFGDGRDRCVEALRLGIPGGLFDPQAKSRRQYRRVYRSLFDHENIAWSLIAIRRKERHKRRIVGVVRGQQQCAVRREVHFINPKCPSGGQYWFGGAR